VLLLLVLAFTRGAARPPRSPAVPLETAYLAHDQLTTDGLSTLSELTTLLTQAVDPATAQQVAPAIQEATRRVKTLAVAGGQLPPITPEFQDRLTQQHGADREAAVAAMKAQLLRIREDPSLSPILGPAILQALRTN
jgi:hypothetical protein